MIANALDVSDLKSSMDRFIVTTVQMIYTVIFIFKIQYG